MNIRVILIFFLSIVIFFTILELNKNYIGLFFEKSKTNLIRDETQGNTRIVVKKDNNLKTFIVLKNINTNDTSKTRYWSYDIIDKKIQFALFSKNLIYFDDSIIAKTYTQYKNNLIKDFDTSKKINLNLNNLLVQEKLVKNLTKKNNFEINPRLINLTIFFILFFNFIFLNFLSKNYVSNKQSIKNPIFLCLIILVYSFLIFNNSLSLYKQEFEFLASLVISLFFLKVYLNE